MKAIQSLLTGLMLPPLAIVFIAGIYQLHQTYRWANAGYRRAAEVAEVVSNPFTLINTITGQGDDQ